MGKTKKTTRPRGKAARKPACRHTMFWWMAFDGNTEVKCPESEAQYRRCCTCHVQLPLGPSNDDSEAVRVEMRAAEIAACDGDLMSDVESSGYGIHPFADDHPGYAMDGAGSPAWFAGWLASEIDSRDLFDAYADAWPWDPTRPVAGQWEEHVGSQHEFAEVARTGRGYPPANESADAELLAAADAVDPDDHALTPPVNPLDTPIRAGAPEAIGLTPRQLREQTAAQVAAEDALRDPKVTARNAARIYEAARAADPDPRDEDDEETDRLVAAAAYELDRASEPDCRDEDGPEVERLMAEVEVPGRLTTSEAAECAALSDSDVCQACGDEWTKHGQTCAGSEMHHG